MCVYLNDYFYQLSEEGIIVLNLYKRILGLKEGKPQVRTADN